MFTRSLSEPNAPAAASPESAARAIRTQGENIANVLKLGGEVYGGYRELDIESSIEAGRAAREEAFQSNERAFIQQQDYIAAQQRLQEQQNKQVSLIKELKPIPEEEQEILLNRIAAGEGALQGFSNEAQRLREAYKAGMSNAEYFTRIAAITKKAIAKYPALSDQIRQQMSKVSGLPGADEFASFSYIKRSFGGGGDREGQRETGGPTKDDIKLMAEATGKLEQDIVQEYNSDPAAFSMSQAAARSLSASRMQGKAVQQALDTKLAEGSLTADENKPIFQLLARTNFQNAVSTLVVKQPDLMNVFYKQLAGTAPAIDQVDTANKMFQATMKQSLDANKVITMRQIDDYAQRGTIPFQKREEIKKLVQEEYDNSIALFSDPNAGMAIASVMKTHQKESADKQIRLMELNVSIMKALTGTKIQEAWFSGDKAQRDKLKQTHPELSKMLEDAENAVIGIGSTVQNNLKVAGQLQVVENVVKDAKTSPNETPARDRLTDQVVSSLAQGALDRYKKDKKPKPEDVNALSTFLSNANNGAGFPTLRANETVIRDFMTGLTEQEKPAVFQAVEKAYGRELQSRVLEWERVSKKEGWNFPVVFTSDGKVQLVNNVEVKPSATGTITNVPAQGQPSIYASAEEWARYREAQAAGTAGSQRVEDPQYVLANSYFNATIAPRIIASTLVRSVVTGEQKSVAAKVASDALNEKKFSQYMPFMPVSTAGAGRGGQGGPTAEELSGATPAASGGQQPATPGVSLVVSSAVTTEKFLKKLSEAESGNEPTAKAATSSATGLFQFTEDTWKNTVKQMGKDYSLEDRKDPVKSKEAAKFITEQNADVLRKALGEEPDESELYTAHFLGATTAVKFLKAKASTPVNQIVSPAAIEANKSIFLDKDGKPRSKASVQAFLVKKMS